MRPQRFYELVGQEPDELQGLASFLHGVTTGGTDGWDDKAREKVRQALQIALDEWVPGPPQFEEYDKCVFGLVRAACDEYDEKFGVGENLVRDAAASVADAMVAQLEADKRFDVAFGDGADVPMSRVDMFIELKDKQESCKQNTARAISKYRRRAGK